MNNEEAVQAAIALQQSGAAVIHKFEAFDQLPQQMQYELSNGKAVIFIPKGQSRRYFYTAESFGRLIKERVLPSLIGYRIVIEPDLYVYDFILAVEPVEGDANTVRNDDTASF